ncbi:MAG: carboxymuconolactone decarboxylase family protein [Gemmatimonadetes bacterium]|nr:carboxymuconolactone decarboxylase family protein [Gemmatimonadota bacterium]
MEQLDSATAALVRFAAAVAAGDEAVVRGQLDDAVGAKVPYGWLEEVVLQSYLFAGFPRALNAMRELRRVIGDSPAATEPDGDLAAWRADGEATCAAVYGASYEKLRKNIRHLHPALDNWMVIEGYGKVLSRPGLDLARRELCIIAACAAQRQQRQLHSHLRGALNVGVAAQVISAALDAMAAVIGAQAAGDAHTLWAKVSGATRVH